MDWLDKRFPRIRMEESSVTDNDSKISDREERDGSDSSEGATHKFFYTEVDFNHCLAEEDRPSQGSHPRGSFVKKGGDWRCVSFVVSGRSVQNRC